MLYMHLSFSDHCAKQGKEYSDCGKTCANMHLNSQDLRCVSGCFCKNGSVLHENGTCVEKNQCGCREGSEYFKEGDFSPSDCSK